MNGYVIGWGLIGAGSLLAAAVVLTPDTVDYLIRAYIYDSSDGLTWYGRRRLARRYLKAMRAHTAKADTDRAKAYLDYMEARIEEKRRQQ